MTNEQVNTLAARFGAGARTIRRWINEGAPLDDDAAMRDWIQGRKHRPRGFDEAQNFPALTREAAERLFWDAGRIIAACAGHRMEMPGFDLGDKFKELDKLVKPLGEVASAIAKVYKLNEE